MEEVRYPTWTKAAALVRRTCCMASDLTSPVLPRFNCLAATEENWHHLFIYLIFSLSSDRKRTAPQASETLIHAIKKKSVVLCTSCGRDLSEESIFHLPCGHVMCRSCLLNVTQQKDSEHECIKCRAKFKQMDVVRVHNK